MLVLHPNILESNGQKEFAILPWNEFLKVKEMIEDWEDLRDLEKAIAEEKSEPGVSLSEFRKQLGL